MDGLNSTSLNSTGNLGSDLGPLGDDVSPAAQASWDQAAADAGLDRDGTDSWGNPSSDTLDVTDPATASAPSQDSTTPQGAEQPAQGDASSALPTAALGGTAGAATMDGAAAGGSGLLADLGLGGLARTAAGLRGSGLIAPMAGALAFFWPSYTASNDTAPPGGWPAQPQATPGVDSIPTSSGTMVESNPGNEANVAAASSDDASKPGKLTVVPQSSGSDAASLPPDGPQEPKSDPEKPDEDWANKQRYDDASYHGRTSQLGARGVKSEAPADGPAALRSSYKLSENSPRRIAYDAKNKQFVVLDRTADGLWHGHVRTWDALSQFMRNTLTRNGITNPRGKIMKP